MSDGEQIEALAKLLRNLPVNRVDLSYEGDSNIIADFIINAGYRLPESEKKECEHVYISGNKFSIGGYQYICKVCGICKPTPAVNGIVWPSRKDAIANGDGKGNVDEWSMGWNACHDAHKQAREDYERGIGK